MPTEQPDPPPSLDDVIEPEEQPAPDRREHAKEPPRPDDDELERRTRHEREVAGLPEDRPPQ